ncbi:MAG: hypothetical protein KGS09_15925 [Nitrospirae bacterium]|nr:hypothetical protein [Nitrospirota bacterium]MBU6482025.1 hypothetical protein [Nitrospirota bacterium]MDE3039035.1 hypothetical protein [Nitrospirota bacterium]MDE3051626.1 hypothetical protein [Nitrospirota bacterium]MDE3221060.1 hypothetical protein [Nitrospirota bacterium]
MLSAELIQSEKSTTAPPPSRVPARRVKELPSSSSGLGQFGSAFTLSVLGWAAYEAAYGKYYTPRSNFGFYLGVVGTLMMLLLLAYPLRKHVQWMQRWGALKHWFRVHMIMGIVGPLLVLFHSTFQIRSTNAAVALFSMLGVVISGIIGRFVYTKIHYGLYGSRATLGKIQEEFAGRSNDAKSRLHFAPRVEQWLQSFERESTQLARSFISHLFNFLTLGIRRGILEFRCARELRRILKAERHPEFRGGASEAIQLASSYLRECQRVAQFSTYERFFSLWHVLHIPLIYILAASTVFHIIAVYMY